MLTQRLCEVYCTRTPQPSDSVNESTLPALLGVKTSCKDRWRQVLSEADRITNKHLLTLEPGISKNQTNEMRSNRLQLVLPLQLHETYSDEQKASLISFADFLELVSERQNSLEQHPH